MALPRPHTLCHIRDYFAATIRRPLYRHLIHRVSQGSLHCKKNHSIDRQGIAAHSHRFDQGKEYLYPYLD